MKNNSYKVLIPVFIVLLCVNNCVTQFGYVIDSSFGLGRVFDGVGGISGGGATSKLLVNYPKEQRDQILDYLFKPNFGASLHILKVEIGGDGQSSEGTELSHMHNSWDENYHRGYEWWMMQEAKTRNPDIKLYGLPWSFPGWIGQGSDYPYTNVKVTANYITKWILGAKKTYSLNIDYIGIWNEKPYNSTYIETLRETLDSNGLKSVQIVAADMIGEHSWDIAKDLLHDPKLNASVAYLGAHYTDTLSTPEAQKCGKPLWSSEDYSYENSEVGGGCMAKILNHNYINGNITATIAWNLIAAYYEKLPYPRKGLMTAEQPWSGHYEVNSPIWTAAHTTQFTSIGWQYLGRNHGVGKLQKEGTYVTYISPDKKQFTLVLETMDTQTYPMCMSSRQVPQKPLPQNATFILKGEMAKVTSLNVWYTKLGLGKGASTYFKHLPAVKVVDGKFTVSLGVNEVYTFTTLTSGFKGQHQVAPPSKTFPLPYKDDFEGYSVNQEANNLAQQVGAFEVTDSHDAQHGKVYRQVVLDAPVHWCPFTQSQPLTVIGNYNWSNMTVAADVRLSSTNKSSGAFIALRISCGGCVAFLAEGVYFYIVPGDNKFDLTGNIGRVTRYATGDIQIKYDTWYRLSLSVKGDSVHAMVDNKAVFTNTVNIQQKNGFVGFGSDSFGVVDFDNFSITSA